MIFMKEKILILMIFKIRFMTWNMIYRIIHL